MRPDVTAPTDGPASPPNARSKLSPPESTAGRSPRRGGPGSLGAEPGNLPRMPAGVVPVGRDWVDDQGGIVTTDRPDTIVLIHGFWVTPRSWEHWIDHYERKGFRVLAPAYPGFEVEVEALNADPTPIEEVTVPAIIEHLASIIRPIDPPPILIGPSATSEEH